MTKQTRALILYLVYGFCLTLTLTFGTMISNRISKEMKFSVDYWMHRSNITDVKVDQSFDEPLAVDKTYYPTYTAKGSVGSDAGLVFEALDDTIVVNKNTGSFRGVRTDADVTTGRIRIISRYDLDFEKIITVRFEKRYPSEFQVHWFMPSIGVDSQTAYVGIPIYLYTHITSDEFYSEDDFNVAYDPAYFELNQDGSIVPIQPTPEGETRTLQFTYGDGSAKTTKGLVVLPSPATESFDEVRFFEDSGEKLSTTVQNDFSLLFFQNGVPVYSDYMLTFDEPNIKYTHAQTPYFTKAGTYAMTITLPNGFSKTVPVDVKNIINLPTLDVSEDKIIRVTVLDKYTFDYSFPSETTYRQLKFEYNKSVLTLTNSGGAITLSGNRAGETTLKVIVDDGYQRVEESYRVIVTDAHTIKTKLANNLSYMVSKGGHLFGFFVLAFFALHLARNLSVHSFLIRFGIYNACGMFFAVLTEFIQFFMSTRDASLRDVVIDMIGFCIGTFVAVPLFAILGRLINGKRRL